VCAHVDCHPLPGLGNLGGRLSSHVRQAKIPGEACTGPSQAKKGVLGRAYRLYGPRLGHHGVFFLGVYPTPVPCVPSSLSEHLMYVCNARVYVRGMTPRQPIVPDRTN
jgi:hypothetical protein